jgi:hypothetical protein
LDNLLCILGLAGTGLASDKHGLILAIVNQVAVGLVGDSENVRSKFIATATAVDLNHVGSVDRDPLIRIDHDAEETRVGVDEVLLVAFFQIVEDRRLV